MVELHMMLVTLAMYKAFSTDIAGVKANLMDKLDVILQLTLHLKPIVTSFTEIRNLVFMVCLHVQLKIPAFLGKSCHRHHKGCDFHYDNFPHGAVNIHLNLKFCCKLDSDSQESRSKNKLGIIWKPFCNNILSSVFFYVLWLNNKCFESEEARKKRFLKDRVNDVLE
jgi:hypothetical protein